MHTTKGCAATGLCLAFASLLASTAHAQCTDASLCQATTQTLDHGGVQREFHVITPPGKNPGDAAAAVIVGVHGYTQNGKMACEAMLQPYVRELDVIGVCPTGKEQMDPSYGVPTTGWNIGVIDGHHDTWAVHDDVDFIKQAKNFALAQYAVAGNVTYAIGFSCGADMVFQLMCVASSQYSGFAMVGEIGPYKATFTANLYKGEPPYTGEPIKLGTVQGDWARSMVGYSETCDPTPAKPIWQAIGTADESCEGVVRVPEDFLASWNHNADTILGCAATVTKIKRNDLVECHERAQCTEMEPAGKTEICIYEGMPHIYPSVPTAPQSDGKSDVNGAAASYQATPAAWAFWNKKSEESATTADAAKNIVATAQATGDLSSLVTALTLPGQAAVLAALQGAGPFTVFAPTNAGFEALKTLKNTDGVSLYDFVTTPANAAVLTKILQYHVLGSEVKKAAAVTAAQANSEVATLLGEKVKLKMEGENVMVDNSKVTATDVMTSNGVVHLIDNVLVPPTLRDTVKTFTAAAARTNPPTTQTAASSASTLAVFSGAMLAVVAALCL